MGFVHPKPNLKIIVCSSTSLLCPWITQNCSFPPHASLLILHLQIKGSASAFAKTPAKAIGYWAHDCESMHLNVEICRQQGAISLANENIYKAGTDHTHSHTCIPTPTSHPQTYLEFWNSVKAAVIDYCIARMFRPMMTGCSVFMQF